MTHLVKISGEPNLLRDKTTNATLSSDLEGFQSRIKFLQNRRSLESRIERLEGIIERLALDT